MDGSADPQQQPRAHAPTAAAHAQHAASQPSSLHRVSAFAPGHNTADKTIVHIRLHQANQQLKQLVTKRQRELQLLCSSPMVRQRRSQMEVEQIILQGNYACASEMIGLRDNPCHAALPKLPRSLHVEVLSANDLLLALAGHMPHQAVDGCASTSMSSSALPRSLSMVTWLPALRSLSSPSLEWLRIFFNDMRPQQRQVGIDDRLLPWFKELKLQAAAALVQDSNAMACRNFAKFGVPHALRGQVWEHALGLGRASSKDEVCFEALCAEVAAGPLLLDMAVAANLAAIEDSEDFFLFEEMLRCIALAFTRDTSIASNCSVQPDLLRSTSSAPSPCRATQALASTSVTQLPSHHLEQQHTGGTTKQQAELGSATYVQQALPAEAAPQTTPKKYIIPSQQLASLPSSTPPPSLSTTILPMHGAVLLAAPLCYLYSSPAALYRVHRALYCRHWCKLCSLDSVGLPAPALPVLVKICEDMLQVLDPQLVSHIHGMCVPLASLVLPWITSAFVGYLTVEETLLLWDRIIGLDSLLPLPLLAVAIISFRRQCILATRTAAELHHVVADVAAIHTVPLLQAVLFQG